MTYCHLLQKLTELTLHLPRSRNRATDHYQWFYVSTVFTPKSSLFKLPGPADSYRGGLLPWNLKPEGWVQRGDGKALQSRPEALIGISCPSPYHPPRGGGYVPLKRPGDTSTTTLLCSPHSNWHRLSFWSTQHLYSDDKPHFFLPFSSSFFLFSFLSTLQPFQRAWTHGQHLRYSQVT